ncbi:hypothetical protein BpHYR1_050157 [Brachionus plicatilis]|uniref:Uncharacterized protein n=1 Tax=Brachionus plicatilis TaxID=10195 RepID=A0A3M7Q580_BRAPC|nr:hypothetical protein BpHYR1_050157 [Brachionus plicatilis]
MKLKLKFDSFFDAIAESDHGIVRDEQDKNIIRQNIFHFQKNCVIFMLTIRKRGFVKVIIKAKRIIIAVKR